MKRIRNKYQLEEEKLRLRVKQLELEKTLHSDWAEMKDFLGPKKVFQTAFHLEGGRKYSLGDMVIQGLHVAATSLANKVFREAEEKAGRKIDLALQQAGSLLERKWKK